MIPGDYYVVAYPGSVTRTPQDPDFVTQLAPLATRITIGDAEAKTMTITSVTVR